MKSAHASGLTTRDGEAWAGSQPGKVEKLNLNVNYIGGENEAINLY